MNFKEYINLDYESIANIISNNLKYEINKRGFQKAVIGLSGGLDSSVSLKLLINAIDKQNIFAFYMPYKTSSKIGLEHVELITDKFDIDFKIIDITEQIDIYFKNEDRIDKLRIGNKCARERMSILFDQALKYNALVIGTSNRSELIMGYGTLFGDLGYSLNPLGNLYKTQIIKLAEFLDIPREIINKKPTADLWEEQTDEDEMGISYELIDSISYLYFDKNMKINDIVELGFKKEYIDKILQAYQKNAFKRELPCIIELKNSKGE